MLYNHGLYTPHILTWPAVLTIRRCHLTERTGHGPSLSNFERPVSNNARMSMSSRDALAEPDDDLLLYKQISYLW